MWKELPEPKPFLWHLRRKAHILTDVWPTDIKIERFTAEFLEEPTASSSAHVLR